MAGYTKTNNSDRISTLVDNLNTVSQDVGNLTELNTLVDSDLTSAINELHDSIDGISSRLDSLDTFVGVTIPLATAADTVVGAINELHDSMGTVALTTAATDLKSAINEHETDIGNMTLTGYTATDISAALREVMTELGDVTTLSTNASTAVKAINEHETDIGNMTFTGLSATDISAAIRELRTELGDHTALTTTQTASVVAAINEINSELYNTPDGSGSNFTTTAGSVEGAINELDSDIGALTDLTTTDKANVVAAVNELDSDIGSLSSLSTTDKENVVAAINEVDGNVDSNYTRLTQAESDIDSNYTRLTQAESDIDSNYTRLTTAESDILTLDSRVDSIDGVLFANPGDSLNTTNQTVILAINEINSELHGITDGDGTDLTTSANTFAGAINELDSDVGSLSSLSTTDKANVISAINEVHDDAFNVLRYAGDSTQLADSIGDNLNLTTAINEVYAFAVQIDGDQSTVNTRVGSLSNLATNDKTSTVNAINELHDSIDGFINHGDASLLSLSVDSSLVIPVGTTDSRPTPPTQGEIRYNTTDQSFEGYGGSVWGSLGGVKDANGDTYIIAERVAQSDSDTLQFYTEGNLALTLTNDSAIFTGNIAAQDASFSGNIAAQDASFAKITGDSATFTNLTVSGTTTYVNTETLEIDDNMIELNSNVNGAPTENAGIEVERGNLENVRLQWNEDLDRWQATDSDGVTVGFNRNLNIVREKDLVGGNHISITNSTFNHNAPAAEDTNKSSSNTGRNYIQSISVDGFGHIRSITAGEETYEYTLPAATASTLGGIELFNSTVNTEAANTVSTTSGRTYGLQLNGDGQGVINVPWTDTWNANAVSVPGYVAAPGVVSGKVWKTDANGNPAWRDEVDNYVGTVTTVTLSEGEGMAITGGPITTDQEVTITLDLADLPIDGTEYNPTEDQIVYINNGVQKKKSFGTFNVKNSSGTVVAKLLRAD